jgi:hypothetical protein
MTNSMDPKEVQRNLMEQAEKRFGAERSKELEPEIQLMAEQLATLRATPVDLQDEP